MNLQFVSFLNTLNHASSNADLMHAIKSGYSLCESMECDPVNIKPQPDGITCGPTSLNAVYDNMGIEVPIDNLCNDLEILNEENGTYAQVLGIDALKRGLHATLYSYNFDIVDPTWKDISMKSITAKLNKRIASERDEELHSEMDKMLDFLDFGGQLITEELTPELFANYFKKKVPLICMLCCTYLYDCKREHTDKSGSDMDDINGDPCGHFVVAYGFDDDGNVLVADPDKTNPSGGQHYTVPFLKLSNAIMLDKGAILAIE